MLEGDYENQKVIEILKQFFSDNEIDANYCELYEKLEGNLL